MELLHYRHSSLCRKEGVSLIQRVVMRRLSVPINVFYFISIKSYQLLYHGSKMSYVDNIDRQELTVARNPASGRMVHPLYLSEAHAQGQSPALSQRRKLFDS